MKILPIVSGTFVLSLFLLVSSISINAQTQIPSGHIYFIQFVDKPTTSFEPQMYFSERAIERRKKRQIVYDEKDKPINELYINKLNEIGLRIWQKSRWLNGVLAYTQDKALIDRLKEASYITKISYLQEFIPSAPILSPIATEEIAHKTFTNKESIFAYNYSWYRSLAAEDLVSKHDATGLTIAVIDAGFLNANKLYCFSHIHVDGSRDFITNDANVYDDDAHGTDVLSCMAASDSGQLIGTARGARYLLLRSEDAIHEMEYEEILWTVAAEYADSAGADLINTSLGYNKFDRGPSHEYRDLDGKTSFIAQAATIAASRGIWVFVSAGNEGNDSWKHITTPADASGITAVGAAGANGREAYFASSGPTVDGRMSPHFAAPGTNIYTANANTFRGYHLKNGSSFATPIACGLAASLMQKYPNASIESLHQLLLLSCNHYPDTDLYIGFGYPRFDSVYYVDPDSCSPQILLSRPHTDSLLADLELCSVNKLHTRSNGMASLYIQKNHRWKRIKTYRLIMFKAEIDLTPLKKGKHYRLELIHNAKKVYTEFDR